MAMASLELQGLAGPAYIDEINQLTGEPWRFFRTKVEEPGQLTNGRAWIQTFEHVLKNLPRPRRTLGVSLSDSGDPRYSMPAYGVKQRNDAAKAMREPSATPDLPEGARHGIGTQLRLPSGDEVLLIANVGPHAPAQLPNKFREMPLDQLSLLAVAAKCPHMGACLNEGEIKDVEDIVAPQSRRAIIRCPWHNMQFDLHTGEGIGNHNWLQRYPVRVMHGAVYVAVRVQNDKVGGGAAGPAPSAACGKSHPLEVGESEMAIDMEGEPTAGALQGECGLSAPIGIPVAMPFAAALPHSQARSRSPPRVLRQHMTIC